MEPMEARIVRVETLLGENARRFDNIDERLIRIEVRLEQPSGVGNNRNERLTYGALTFGGTGIGVIIYGLIGVIEKMVTK